MRLLFWLSSESPSETYSYNLASILSPSSSIPGFFFHGNPRAIYGRHRLQRRLQRCRLSASVWSFPTAPNRVDLLEGPSWLPCGDATLPLIPSGLMNRANSRRELCVLCFRRTHTHAPWRAFRYIILLFFVFLKTLRPIPLIVGADLYRKCTHANMDTQRARAYMQAVRRNSFCGSGCVPVSQ